MGIKSFNVTNLGSVGLLNPEQVGYRDSVEIIKDESFKIQKSFVKVGWYLRHIRDKKLYIEDGYANIYECAADLFGYSQSTVSRFINICEKFSKDHNSPELDTRYAGFDKSQMIEMLPLNQDELEKVTPDMTVAQIRDIKSERSSKKSESQSEEFNVPGQTSIENDFPEYMPGLSSLDNTDQGSEEYATSHNEVENLGKPEDTPEKVTNQPNDSMKPNLLSPLGYAKSEYPEGSLIATEGCGNKYDCYSCAQFCEIREEERYCVEAPLGNPFSCTILLNTQIEDLPEDKCQFINHELAFHRAGDNQPVPCCKKCEEHCMYRCTRAMKSDEISASPELPILKNNPKSDHLQENELTKDEDSLREEILEYVDRVDQVFRGWEGQDIPREEAEAARRNVNILLVKIEKLLAIIP